MVYINIIKHSPELTRWQQIVGPFLNVVDWNIEAWRDNTAFVEAAGQVDDNFAGTMVVDDFEFTNVTMFHHDSQKFDDDFGAWAQQNLAFATFLSVVDAFQGIGQNIHSHHCVWKLKWNVWVLDDVCLKGVMDGRARALFTLML